MASAVDGPWAFAVQVSGLAHVAANPEVRNAGMTPITNNQRQASGPRPSEGLRTMAAEIEAIM
jgi:hypothetical protein